MKHLSCTVLIFIAALQNSSAQTITSLASGNWSNSTTWDCTCIPDSNDSVVIASGHSVALTNNIGIQNLTIDNSASLSSNNHTISITGDWINNGAFNEGSGTVIFNGNANAQSIQGFNTFYNLTVDNSTAVNIISGSQQQVRNIFALNSGTFNIPAGDSLILVSDSLRTARLAEITGGSIIGDITMERFIDTIPTGWLPLASSIQNATMEQWNDDFPMTFPSFSFPSVYFYDEFVPGPTDSGWLPVQTVFDPISLGRGYICYNADGNANVGVTGAPGTGSVILSVTYLISNGPAHDGWNLMGNPYPCTIDWEDPTWIKTNINPGIHVYHPSGYGAAYVTGGPGINGGSRYIPSSGAFWVQTMGTGPVLGLMESIKDTIDAPFFPASDPESIYDFVMLTITGNGYSDQTAIRMVPGALNGFDSIDVHKFRNGDPFPIFSSLGDSFDFAINSISDLTQPVDIPVRLTWSWPGATYSYTIGADLSPNFPGTACVILEDLSTGIFTNLRDTSYTFTEVMDTALPPRFVLHLAPPIKIMATGMDCPGDSTGSASVSVSGIGPWNFVWTTASGDTIQSVENTSDSTDTVMGLGAGTYLITAENTSGFCGIVSDTLVITEPGPFNVSIDIIMDVNCNAGDDGSLSVTSTGGTPGYTYQWNDPASQTDSLATGLLAGTYSVSVTDSLGCVAVDSEVIAEPPALSISTGSTADTSGAGVGVAWVNVLGGEPPYTYQWADPASQITDTAFNLAAGTYNVTVVDSNGCTVNASALVSDYSGISDNVKKTGMRIYPNPTVGSFTIAVDALSVSDIRIYGIKGDLIKQVALAKGKSNLMIKTIGWECGSYICVLFLNGEKVQSKQVVIE